MTEERRKSIRIKKVITVRYSFNDEQGEKKWDITAIRDLSETGMCITTQQTFNQNEIINLSIKMPSKPMEWMDISGRVVGTEKVKTITGESLAASHITRVEFINLGGEQKELIREYINWFLTKGGGKK